MTDPRIPIDQALTALESGFCLWIGAGVTKQILADKKLAPLWPELTRELEEEAGLIPGSDTDGRYPERGTRGRIREWAQTMKAIDPDKVQRCLQLSGEFGEQGPGSGLGFDVYGCVQAVRQEIEGRFKLNLPVLQHGIGLG